MKNAFASCDTVEALEFHYEILTSPENISHDGERPYSAQKKAIAQLNKQYLARLKQLSK